MLRLTFSRKKTFHIYFFIVFSNKARKSCAPFIEILVPHKKSLHGKILPRNPPSQLSPLNQKKSPWNVCTLPSNHYLTFNLTKRNHLTLLNLCQTSNTFGVKLDSLINNLKNDLGNVKLNLSIPQSSLMLFSFLKNIPPINNYLCIPNLNMVKLLGVHLDNELKWKSHSFLLFKTGGFPLRSFSLLKRFSISIQNLKIIYCSYIRPCLEYVCPVWHPGLTESQCSKIESIQKRAIKIILGTSYTTYDEDLARLELTTLESRRHFLTMNFRHKCLSSDYHRRLLPPFKENRPILPNKRLNARRAPNTQLDLCPQMLTMRYKNSFVPYFVSHFNNWFNFVTMFIP